MIPRPGAPGLHMLNVSHAFGDNPVVKGVSVFVQPGELVCLLGPSGCGKTTLLRLAAGLETLQIGRIAIGEEIVAEGHGGPQAPPEKRGVGLMFQDFALFPHLTVYQNVVFGLLENARERRHWAQAALDNMGLASYREAYPHVLSGGQQQRVALLRALAPAPRVLLLDEPFSGLDVTLRAQIRQDTFEVLKQAGIATLMVTHDPEEAMFMADRILVMKDGRIVQSGAPAEIYSRPESVFVAELFGPVNRLRGRVSGGTLDTPLGRFPAPDLDEGASAQALIRPEALIVTAGATPAPFRVLTARTLGRSSHLTLGLETGSLHLQARVPRTFLPEPGTAVAAGVDPADVLVFPLDGA